MAYEVEKRHVSATDDSDALKTARTFSQSVTVIDSNGQHHSFRKFEWLGGSWGICNADKTKIIVRAKANYLYVKVLDKAKVLIAGSTDYGWDVHSLEGCLLETLRPMALEDATRFLNARKRDSQ